MEESCRRGTHTRSLGLGPGSKAAPVVMWPRTKVLGLPAFLITAGAAQYAPGLPALLITAGAAQYAPTWDSLDTRPLPTWYDDAKVGIFIHWGVFSVPSFGVSSGGASGEWFWWEWQGSKDPAYSAFVAATEAPQWTYADYAPRFQAEFFNASQWASLFKASGARYIVPTSKHHEGFTNWPSATSFNWNSVDVGPHRDLIGELATAVKAAGLTFGIYHSLFEWFNPLFLEDEAAKFAKNITTSEFLQKTFGELHDLVNRYEPELIWSDVRFLRARLAHPVPPLITPSPYPPAGRLDGARRLLVRARKLSCVAG